jgi:hypothetical protein
MNRARKWKMKSQILKGGKNDKKNNHNLFLQCGDFRGRSVHGHPANGG